MRRVPLLAGTRLVVVSADDDAVVLRPPLPSVEIHDVGAAVRDALRFPLAGEPLEAMVERGSRATIVVEPPALPIPGAEHDPREAAIDATIAELERLGVPPARQTMLVAGGLTRRAGQRELEQLVAPTTARRFRGSVVVHDAEDPELVAVGVADDGTQLLANRALVDTDVVVVVTAAESVLHGGPATLLAAAGADAARGARATSLVESGTSTGWSLGVELERALARRVRLLGLSLALNLPVVGGAARGYPYEEGATERIARSPLRRLFGLLPAPARRAVMRSLPLELTALAVFAGPPSVAHAEALLRAVEARSADLAEPLDALCVGIPRATPYLPRERPNPLVASAIGLGLALRLWRDAFPVVEGGTAILVHRFHRRFAHPTQQPYRAFFGALQGTGAPEEVAEAERAAAADARAVESYRAGRACHPRLPFSDWDACRPALARLGTVLIAGCRDSVAAKQLGFVPTHGLPAAIEMAHGSAGGRARIGFLLSPPYFPLRVGGYSSPR